MPEIALSISNRRVRPAPGAPSYAANTTVSLGGTEARYVKLTITANWGGLHPQTGLAEVRFFYVPDRSATRP